MHGSILAVLALVALVEGVSCGPVASARSRIDALAQKLEEHYHGENLNNEITFEECLSTFEEFPGLSTDDTDLQHRPDPSLLFLKNFMYSHLKNVPVKLVELEKNEQAAREFIKTLEMTYARFRPIYNYQLSLDGQQTSLGKNIVIAVEHLAGKREQPPTQEQMIQAVGELSHITSSMQFISEGNDIYEHIDEYESLSKLLVTPEVLTWAELVWPLLVDSKKEALYFAGDESTTRELQQVFQEKVAELKRNPRFD